MLAVLRKPDELRRERRPGVFWVPFFLFSALAAGMVMLGLNDTDSLGMFFAALVMGGLALGFLIMALMERKQRNQDTPQ